MRQWDALANRLLRASHQGHCGYGMSARKFRHELPDLPRKRRKQFSRPALRFGQAVFRCGRRRDDLRNRVGVPWLASHGWPPLEDECPWLNAPWVVSAEWVSHGWLVRPWCQEWLSRGSNPHFRDQPSAGAPHRIRSADSTPPEGQFSASAGGAEPNTLPDGTIHAGVPRLRGDPRAARNRILSLWESQNREAVLVRANLRPHSAKMRIAGPAGAPEQGRAGCGPATWAARRSPRKAPVRRWPAGSPPAPSARPERIRRPGSPGRPRPPRPLRL